ncbi:MAG TPA: nitrilase-related carbon-nitrogen hydrolase, partial [Candidatus Obscuribacterales bacterium]
EAVRYMPEWVHRLTNTPAGSGFTSGNAPVVLNLTKAKVGPLICFETISPEEVAATVREGAELLVNLSDLAWFHDSMIGEQMIATSVMRAIENRRYFVFAANTGPSAIVDPRGKVVKKASLGQAEVLTGNVGLMKEFTPFSRWMLF